VITIPGFGDHDERNTQLREREGDPLQSELDAAIKRVGELSMENELLREKIRTSGPLVSWRSRR
jgi:hypothetical protein